MKLKTCKICKAKFMPQSSLVQWCSPECGYKLSIQRLEKKNKFDRIKKKSESETKSQLMVRMQPTFNKIARLIDWKQPCISCSKYGKPQGGHFHASTNTYLRFNLHNIHIQDFRCNRELSGNIPGYIIGLSEVYGEDYCDYVQNRIKLEYKGLEKNKAELLECYEVAKKIVKELESEPKEYTAFERMELRTIYNNRIGIYL